MTEITQTFPPDLPKAMLLDMDDTILALTDTSTLCWTALCADYAPRMRPDTHEVAVAALEQAINASRRWFWSDPLRHQSGRLTMLQARRDSITRALEEMGLPESDLAEAMAEAFVEAQFKQIYAFPGAVETVEQLRRQGVKLALITNGDAQEQRRKINRFNLAPLFDVVIVEGEFGIGKPEPQVYHHAMTELGVGPAETWMVGDNLEWEVIVPKSLGIYTVWVDFAKQGLPGHTAAKPDRIIHLLSELLPAHAVVNS